MEVFKFPNRNIFKVRFTSSTVARKARESGLFMYSLSQIRQEVCIPLVSCDRCYAVKTAHILPLPSCARNAPALNTPLENARLHQPKALPKL